MPDSSLPLTIDFFFYYHSYSAHRSRMTAGVNCDSLFFACCVKRKESETQAVPEHGEGVSGADERGKLEQTRGMILTCVRTLAPIASQGSALPSVFGGS